MSDYRRIYVPGGTYFFTIVTEGRQPRFAEAKNRAKLRVAMKSVLNERPVLIQAMVLLPDHMHTIWTLPEGDRDYSSRLGQIKERFTREFLQAGGREVAISASRRKHRERLIWQRRFWEHTVRDESDFARCFDYIHWNPVKHGLVTRVSDYPWSSFHRYVRNGWYDRHWGDAEASDVPGAEWE
ncbi:MAG: transposase [Gemmataceae bacterium]